MDKASGRKDDSGKPPMGLLDRYALEQVARVMDYGAKKYSRYNWRGGLALSRLYDAALRHVFAFIDGEDLDPDTKLPHIAHAMCCLMFLLRTQRDRPDLDDRYKRKEKRDHPLSGSDEWYAMIAEIRNGGQGE
jgi:hypothetical protein